jgi:hypothetical protein
MEHRSKVDPIGANILYKKIKWSIFAEVIVNERKLHHFSLSFDHRTITISPCLGRDFSTSSPYNIHFFTKHRSKVDPDFGGCPLTTLINVY